MKRTPRMYSWQWRLTPVEISTLILSVAQWEERRFINIGYNSNGYDFAWNVRNANQPVEKDFLHKKN